MLPAAASVVIGLMLIHSAVDYPLRTLALGGVFAFACAVLWSQRRKPQEFQLAHGTQRADG
jgi:hypothetical protein